MITFKTEKEFYDYLESTGVQLGPDGMSLECYAQSHPNMYYQEPNGMLCDSPLFIVDDNNGVQKYKAEAVAHNYDTGEVYKEVFEFETSIPYDSHTILAFETKVFIAFMDLYPQKETLYGFSIPEINIIGQPHKTND